MNLDVIKLLEHLYLFNQCNLLIFGSLWMSYSFLKAWKSIDCSIFHQMLQYFSRTRQYNIAAYIFPLLHLQWVFKRVLLQIAIL